jgi:GH25 family lysozyme M1 (1,4-beta-N-acetylmuramidase)
VFHTAHRVARTVFAALGAAWLAGASLPAGASDFSEPWKRQDRALVIDAYEYNSIDWHKLALDKRIAGFINKASDGLPPAYFCSGDETEIRLCKALWKRHAVTRELFHTRRMMAKALGLKWGAYHLARPGNPIDQADNFVDFAEPGPDDLIALDIEGNDPEKWMSLEDAEEFVRRIRSRTGRFPVLYTNDVTANHIAAHRDRYRLLSRLPLWYARYKPTIGAHFPKGNWESYTLWQFAAQSNCNPRSCPYRVPGTPDDIDVNVASMSADELRAAWPFGALLGTPVNMIASVPVPISRQAALSGDVALLFAKVEQPGEPPAAFASMFALAGGKGPVSVSLGAPAKSLGRAEYQGYLKRIERTRRVAQAIQASYSDHMVTRSTMRAARALPTSPFARNVLPVFLLKNRASELARTSSTFSRDVPQPRHP